MNKTKRYVRFYCISGYTSNGVSSDTAFIKNGLHEVNWWDVNNESNFDCLKLIVF